MARLKNGEEVTGDYLVYTTGPDFSPFKLFDENILQKLEPDTDKNQRFQHGENEAPTTLALKTKDDPTGKTLKIVGAAAARFAPRIDADDTMSRVFRTLPDNAAFTDVLPTIRSATRALNNSMPYDINEHTDYTVDDRTMLAAHLSAKFPTIADTRPSQMATRSSRPLIDGLTKMIVQSRRQRGVEDPEGVLPKGPDVLPIPPHDRQFQEHWEQSIQGFEDDLKSQIGEERE